MNEKTVPFQTPQNVVMVDQTLEHHYVLPQKPGEHTTVHIIASLN